MADDTDHGLLKGRYAIDFNQELPSMQTAGGLAFACRDRESPQERCYALVPKDGAAWRHAVLERGMGRGTPQLVCPIESGSVKVEGGSLDAVILPFPQGTPLALGQPFTEGELRNRLLPDMAAALQTLSALDLAHRGIRPERIYALHGGHSGYALGECLSELPAATQPLLFEPIERALAHPSGRGEGEAADDMFALGVTVITLLSGALPCANLSAGELIAQRIQKGSYLAYMQGMPPRGSFGALLRGLLCDDPRQRWTLEKLRRWLDGVMPAEPVSPRSLTVATGYKFLSETYNNRRLLARALHANFEAGTGELHIPAFQTWLQMAIKDEIGAALLERLFGPPAARGTERSAQRLHAGSLARVIQLLDPEGPLRFRSISVMTDGLAGFVANALSGGQTAFLRDLDELCNRHALYETAVAAVADAPRLRRYAGDFPDVERHIAMPSLGHGPERVLYQLNPGLLCQSPLFEHFHVADMPQLLSALDALAAENPERDLLIDRHIAAFCACRWADSSGLVVDLARNDRRYPERAVFTLRLYALAQEAFGIPSLPSLARHFAAKLTPAVRQLHHGRTKDAMMRRLDRLAAGGSLPRFHDELNFIAVRDRDRERFTAARATVAVIDRHLASIRRGFNPADAEAQSLGQRIAMGAGWLALLLSLSFTVLHGV